MWHLAGMRLLLSLLSVTVVATAIAADFPKPFNTGNDVGKAPMPASEAVKLIEMPPGFKATVFAAEPEVQNPIACTWDSRGRLWVAENYTYADAKTNFDKTLRDRILIFEDTDGDGKADKRTVFYEGLQNLTSIELGYGGVYATAAPRLVFIPMKDGEDKPSGEPETLLDGFDAWGVRHNIVNGLKWGPDGWLYGRHGIQATSKVGAPGTADADRIKLNCCIWRYHPVRKAFEVVTSGGTNSWGLDWNAEGEGFFINTVIGQLYHLVPAAHYERMYGQDLSPHLYQLLPQTADHYHFDTSKGWTNSRDGKANDLGGGHAHSGCMIYQGENWPKEYRGKLFTLNLHGRRINVERLERKGAGYVGKHEPDMIKFGDPWFRGVELTCGPDGGVYVLDWSDDGECHESDGVHRESGRIYKITYGDVKMPDLGPMNDLSQFDDRHLLDLVVSKNEWLSRQARQLIAQHAAREARDEKFVEGATERLTAARDVSEKLRLLWTLHFYDYMRPTKDALSLADLDAMGAKLTAAEVDLPKTGDPKQDDPKNWSQYHLRGYARRDFFTSLPRNSSLFELLEEMSTDKSEYVQSAVIRAVTDWLLDPTEHMEGMCVVMAAHDVREDGRPALDDVISRMLGKEHSTFVRRTAAAFFARDPGWGNRDGTQFLSQFEILTNDKELQADPWMQTYLWQIARVGVGEPFHADQHPMWTTEAWSHTGASRLYRENSGRLFASAGIPEIAMSTLFTELEHQLDPTQRWGFNAVGVTRDYLVGVQRGLRGVAKMEAPIGWEELAKAARKHRELAPLVRDLGAIFGDGRALDEIRQISLDAKADFQTRKQALDSLVAANPSDLRATLDALLQDNDFVPTVLAALAKFDDAGPTIIANYGRARADGKPGVMAALCSRPAFARALLDAVAAGKIPRADLTPYHARQIAALGDADVSTRLGEVWGTVATTSGQKKARMAELKKELTPEVLKQADIDAGRAVFTQTCAACHTLYDLGQQGANLRPNLTGSGRANVDYLLENIVDPSAVVPADYKLSTLTMKDGRVLSGFISTQNDQTLTLRTMTGTETLPKAEVTKTEASAQSLMPEGILDTLTPQQRRDLFGFLMKK